MQLTCSDWQEGLVHFVNAHVVDLVDAHNVAIASQQRQHPQGCPWQQAPIQCLEQTSSVPTIPALVAWPQQHAKLWKKGATRLECSLLWN